MPNRGVMLCDSPSDLPCARAPVALASRSFRARRVALTVLLAAAAACREPGAFPTLPEPSAPLAPIDPSIPAETVRIPLQCRVEVHAGTMRCDAERSTAALLPRGLSPAIIIGGQNVYLKLTSQATSYDAASSVLSSAVSVRNLISQSLGTADGITPDANGVRIFFHAGPTVTGGTGAVTVRNADGTGTFTASHQPYFAYTEIIPGNVTSSPKTWQFDMPSTVTTFTFSVFVQTTLRDETLPLVQAARAYGGGQLVAGNATTCAIRSSSGVYCWGSNASGRLGIGGATNLTPYSPVTGPILHGVSANSNADHVCGLNAAGAAYCWGMNAAGQIGDGTTTTRVVATAVAMPSGVTFAKVFTGTSSSCGLTSAGAAYCWGLNSSGQLGDGTTTNRVTPVATAAAFTFTALAPSNVHTCGLTGAGIAYCWGGNGMGQLGDATTTAHLAPATVNMPLGVTFSSLVGGSNTTCALTPAGAQWCWGMNNGTVGDGSYTQRNIPTGAHMGGIAYTQMSTSNAVSCGISAAGAAYCSGSNSSGAVGDGTGAFRPKPVAVSMPSGVTFAQISAGYNYACGLSTAGSSYCWGNNPRGQIGDATTSARYAPVATIMPSGVSFVSITTGLDDACGTTAGGLTYCWGANDAGQLGNAAAPAIASTTSPMMAYGTSDITTLSTGASASHACGLSSAGAAYCWGTNDYGQLGEGSSSMRTMPTAVVMPGGVTFGRIAVGGATTCAVSTAGASYCWGQGDSGQLGNGDWNDEGTPVPSTMPSGVTFTSIAAGARSACALAATGTVYCWGDNWNNQLGDGTGSHRTAPTSVAMPSGVAFSGVALGDISGCALASSGVVYCWGHNGYGQLGDGTTTSRAVPTTVTMPSGVTFTTVVLGANHSCATSTTGTAYCWGHNSGGQLGDGSVTSRSVPTLVAMPNGVTFTSLAAGASHTCGMTPGNTAYCWGINSSGQLGDGTTVQRLTPTASALP